TVADALGLPADETIARMLPEAIGETEPRSRRFGSRALRGALLLAALATAGGALWLAGGHGGPRAGHPPPRSALVRGPRAGRAPAAATRCAPGPQSAASAVPIRTPRRLGGNRPPVPPPRWQSDRLAHPRKPPKAARSEPQASEDHRVRARAASRSTGPSPPGPSEGLEYPRKPPQAARSEPQASDVTRRAAAR